MSDQFEIENSVQREKRIKKRDKFRTALLRIWQKTRKSDNDVEYLKEKIDHKKIDIDGYTLFLTLGHRTLLGAEKKIGWESDGTRKYDKVNTVTLFDLDEPESATENLLKELKILEALDPENIIIEERPNISFFRRKLGYEPKDKEKTKYKTKSIGGKHKRKSRKSRKSRRRR